MVQTGPAPVARVVFREAFWRDEIYCYSGEAASENKNYYWLLLNYSRNGDRKSMIKERFNRLRVQNSSNKFLVQVGCARTQKIFVPKTVDKKNENVQNWVKLKHMLNKELNYWIELPLRERNHLLEN